MSPFRALFHPRTSPELVEEPTAQGAPGERSESNTLWRKAALRVWPLGSDQTAVQASPSPAVHVLPTPVADWLNHCTGWEMLEDHLEILRRRYTTDAQEWETFSRLVPQILEAKLLISSDDLLGWCGASASPQSQRISIAAIGFPTGGAQGLELAPRAVRSFAENMREHGREADLIVCDSSLSAELREGQRARLRALAQQLGRPIRYAGAEEKQQFAAKLARLGACAPEVAEFALGDPFETGFAPGANRNMLLLDQAGSMFCSVDHDVLCQVARAPEHGSALLSFFSQCDPFARWTFTDRAEADRVIRWETPDHLALHEEMLGKGCGERVPKAADAGSGVDFRNTDDALIARLAGGPSRIRATFCGHSGEPGVPSAAYYLAYRGVNRERLTKSEAHYRAALSSRSLLALSPIPAIGDASLSPGVAFGMDHRELLPPFFPVLHAEDFSWSALAWQCCPGAVFGLLPWAVAHEPIPGKAFLQMEDFAQLPPFVIWEWAHLVRFWTVRWQPPGSADAGARVRAFGRLLAEIGALPAVDFTHEMREAALATVSHQMAYYDAQLMSEGEHLPEFWRADLDIYLKHLQWSVTQDGFELPLDLRQQGRSLSDTRAFAQKLVRCYAEVLTAWPDMVAAAREVKRNGRVWEWCKE